MVVVPPMSMTEHRGLDPRYSAVREAPSPALWQSNGAGPPVPDGRPEPVLAMANIQGNIVAGFNKDFQTLLYFHIDDARQFKPAVAELGHRVATAAEVLAFNRLFKHVVNRRGYPGTLKSTWMSVAFSFAGLAKLSKDAALFADRSFQGGWVKRSTALDHSEGWKVEDGPGDNAADVLIIVAADTEDDVEAEVTRVKELVKKHGGSTLAGQDEGRSRSDSLGGKSLRGHEHFGFLDGISQPGLRGRASEGPTDLLTPRQNPHDQSHGKPGQELIWPGEFVFGYPGQDGSRDGNERGGDSSIDGAGYPCVPKWAKDGSYLVFNRFKQDVYAFHQHLHAEGKKHSMSPTAVGAQLFGRWPSGAPIMRMPTKDDPDLAGNDCANNHFGFKEATQRVAGGLGNECPRDDFRLAGADPDGNVCPFTSHIRKVNPRDDVAAAVRRRHRLLRRGICFGEPSASTPDEPQEDKVGVERGLLFLAYMTSIADQYEFIIDHWISNPDFLFRGIGHDAVLGQQDKGWILPTGGGYYFTPSVSALRRVLSK